VGGYLVMGDALTAGTLVAFVLYVERFFDPIRELAQRYNTFQATMAASERVFEPARHQAGPGRRARRHDPAAGARRSGV
jgi:ABC-type multidrug transport system fused ATPase/permease subunit